MQRHRDVWSGCKWSLAALLAGASCGPAVSQETTSSRTADTPALEEVVVSGIRATQRNSIEVKRAAAVIVDALVNEELGELPAQSVGEALERVTGVSADRFKGSASEISVRGLGPFLGFSTLNGREVTSGSGDRAVSFQQFPAELVNGVLVYKTQQADFVEGGVSGVVELKTLRPLDFGQQSFQAEARANYLPYDAHLKNSNGLGYRASASYVDQYETGAGGMGVSIGYARTDSAAPEDFYTASADFRPCNSINTTPEAVAGGTAEQNCSYVAGSPNPLYFVANQYSFRQMETGDERDAVMGAFQWQPGDAWDINFDVQLSDRYATEDRRNLTLAEGRRGTTPDAISADNALLEFRGNSYLDNTGTYRIREEKYRGGGLNVEWLATDALTLSGDLSYSWTHRNQLDRSTRLRSNSLFGPGGRVAYTFTQSDDTPSVTFAQPINLNDHAAFTTNGYAQRRMEDREDEIYALRLDGDYKLGWRLFESIGFGARYSDHARVTDLGNNNDIDPVADERLAAGNANCRINEFPQDDWMQGSSTNVSSWATFDTLCLYQTFAGTGDLGPLADSRSANDLDITEKITALYAMGVFEWELGAIPVSGNVGVRFVRTDIGSLGYRGAYDVVSSGGTITLVPIAGTFDTVSISNTFTNVLPSANFTFRLPQSKLLRLGVYRALARPNIEDMGAGRGFSIEAGATSVEDAIAGVTGGNPRLEPLQSWNIDIGLEWYPNPDTVLAGAVYYKLLEAGIVPAYANILFENFVIDGQTYTLPVSQEANADDTRNLFGFELTAQHTFTNLPPPFNGLGLGLNYNYADSNFEYEDPSAVDAANPLRNFTAPAGINGLSKHVGSVTGFYENRGLSLYVAYKYRSDYLKTSGLSANRFVEDAGFLDVSVSYDVTEHVQVKLQGLNLLGQEQVMYRPVHHSIAETSYYGPSYFVGARLQF